MANLPEGGAAPARAAVCAMLRTKTAFGTFDAGHDWQSGTSSTAAYWCLATMLTSGPDDALAHAHACREGRRCFRSASE
ncbi:MAG: hypothetical protein HY049_15065 [Acidobacteria bacterium]|nr:hypothetical protein [Acidobacteriota bacterium]